MFDYRACQKLTPYEKFDISGTVGWVIRPVKTVGRITYIVLAQT